MATDPRCAVGCATVIAALHTLESAYVAPMMHVDLWAILHDGHLETVHAADGICTLTIDVPHVRKHQGHEKTQRYQVRCEGVIAHAFSSWEPPADPRPMHEKGIEREAREKADADWFARGIFIAQDWARFVEARAAKEGDFWLQEAALDEAATDTLKLRGNIGNDWCELAVEARVIVFAETSGRVHTTSEFIALGEAYWDAFSAKGEA
jgi:hypothetical protein